MDSATNSEFIAIMTTALDDGIIGYFMDKWISDGDIGFIMMYNDYREKMPPNEAMGNTLANYFKHKFEETSFKTLSAN